VRPCVTRRFRVLIRRRNSRAESRFPNPTVRAGSAGGLKVRPYVRACVRLWPLERSWEAGPERQVLKPRVEVLKPRSWDSGPETSRWGVKPRSWEPNIEVLKPRSWERRIRKTGFGPDSWIRKPGSERTSPSVRPSVTTGRREKWREKDKTTVGWRAFEVLKPSPESQISRSWKPGPESVHALLIGWSN